MKGHNEAVEYLMDVLKGTEIDLTAHLIRHLHQTILQEEFESEAVTTDGKPTKRIIKPGQYKSVPNHVKTKSGNMLYFSTPEDTPSQMSDLMKWFKNEMGKIKSHPLIIASLFHYKFVRIHPFDDGNGRMARLLMNLILMKFGYPPVIVPFGIKDDYYNALQFADAEDFDKFIIFIGERLIESLNLVLKAGKNEPIEVVDDVDKMVKMLENKLNSIENSETNSTKTEESIKYIYDKLFKPYLNKIIETLSKFNQFFNKIDAFYGENLILHSDKELNNLKDYFDALLKIECDGIKFEYCFNYLKKNPQPDKMISIAFTIETFPNSYRLQISRLNWKIENSYDELLSGEETNRIVVDIAKYINNKIEENV